MNKKPLFYLLFVLIILSMVNIVNAGANDAISQGTFKAQTPLDALNNFVDSVGNFVNQAFREIVLFLHNIQIIFMDAGFVLICLFFFLLIIACMYIPIKLYPYWLKAKALYYKIFEKIGNSYNKDR
jgi:hypothetical protein